MCNLKTLVINLKDVVVEDGDYSPCEPFQRIVSPWLSGEDDALMFWEPWHCAVQQWCLACCHQNLTLLLGQDCSR